jgi:hypothetical protein
MSTELDFTMNFEDNEQSDADKKLMVVFYKGLIHNEHKSIEAGRPIFDEIDQIKIMTPGSRDTFVGDATPTYQRRFPGQWARYKAGHDQTIGNGTPLNNLPWMTIGQIAEFNAVGCHTVEQLVGMSDALSQKFMGHLQIKQRAQVYLDSAKGNAPALKLQAELEKRDQQIAELQETVKNLIASQKSSKEGNKVPLSA